MATRLGDIEVILRANSADFVRGLKSAEAQLGKTGSSFKGFADGLAQLGDRLTLGITTPLAGIGGLAVKASADFASAFTKISTLTATSREELEGFRDAVLDVSRQTGRGPAELAEGLFRVTSAGAQGAQALGILSDAAKASALGLGSVSEIALAVTAAVKAFENQNLSARDALETLIGTVEAGNVEASSLASSLGRVTGVAAQVGLSFRDVGAFIATFSRLGVSAEESVTSLRGLLGSLLAPTAEASEVFRQLGTSAADLRAQIADQGLAKTLVELVGAFEGNIEGLRAIIPNVEALAGVLGTAGAQAKDFGAISDQVGAALGTLDGRFKELAETDPSFALDKARASLSSVAIELGDNLVPLATRAADRIRDLADAFGDLGPTTQRTIVDFGLMAAALGPILSLGGRITGAFAGLGGIGKTFRDAAAAATVSKTSVDAWSGALVKTTTSAGLLAKGLAGLRAVAAANPVALFTAGIAAAGVAAVALNNHLSELGETIAKGNDAEESFGRLAVAIARATAQGEKLNQAQREAILNGESFEVVFGKLSDSAIAAAEAQKTAEEQAKALAAAEAEAAKQMKQAAAEIGRGFAQIDAAIAGVRLDALTAGLPAVEQAIAEAAARIAEIGAEFNLTSDQIEAKTAEIEDAIREAFSKEAAKEFNDAIEDIDFEASIEGASELEEELARLRKRFQEIGKEAGLSANEIAERMQEAAEKTREAFSRKIFADFERALRDIKLEADILSQITNRNATEQEKLARAVQDAAAKVDAARDAYKRAVENYGEFDERTLALRNTLRSYVRELDNARAAQDAFSNSVRNSVSTAEALDEALRRAGKALDLATAEDFARGFREGGSFGANVESIREELERLKAAGDAGPLRDFAKEIAALAESFRPDRFAFGPFNQALSENANQIAAIARLAEGAAAALERMGKATKGLEPISLGVSAFGSPELPFSDYFGSYAPRLIDNLVRKAEGAQLRFPVSGASDVIAPARESSGGGDSVERERGAELSLLHDIANLLAASVETERNIHRSVSGGHLGATAAREIESLIRRTTGRRLFTLGGDV